MQGPACASTVTPSPTSKATAPGPNNFSPTPLLPLSPAVKPGQGGAARP